MSVGTHIVALLFNALILNYNSSNEANPWVAGLYRIFYDTLLPIGVVASMGSLAIFRCPHVRVASEIVDRGSLSGLFEPSNAPVFAGNWKG